MDSKNHHPNSKELARYLYTSGGKAIAETARLTAEDEATIRNWIDAGSWNEVRTTHSISQKSQLDCLYAMVSQLTDEIKGEAGPNPKSIDLMLKYTAVIRNLETNNSVYAVIEVAELFIDWLYARNMELAQTVIVELDLFIKERKAA